MQFRLLLLLTLFGSITLHAQNRTPQSTITLSAKHAMEKGRCQVPVEIRTLMMIDSLEMTDGDRSLIAHQCHSCEETQIVVTHGTDTMSETAKVLADKIKDKTIVLTGAMIPIKFGSSDGLFNLGSALAFAQSLPHGVYVAMNGRYFNWDNVRKNKQTGVFEEVK